MARPRPRDDPVTSAVRPVRSRSIDPQPLDGHFSIGAQRLTMVAVSCTRCLQDVVAAESNSPKSSEHPLKVYVTCPQWNRRSTAHSILHVNVDDTIAIA